MEPRERPIPKLKQRKTDQVGDSPNYNEFSQFKEGSNYIDDRSVEEDYSAKPKTSGGGKFSPRQRRLLLKKELAPVKQMPMESFAHYKEPIGKLDKKPSKKLVIKANEKKSESGSGQKMEQSPPTQKDKITEKIDESESIVMTEKEMHKIKERPK